MNQRPRRRYQKKQDPKTLLIGLIGILAAVLVVVLCVALFAGPVAGPGTSTNQTGPSGDTQGSTEGSESAPTEVLGLIFTSPETYTFGTTDTSILFEGTSDPNQALTVNGSAVQRNAEGAFSFRMELTSGKNVFTFDYMGEQAVFTIDCRYVVEFFSPEKEQVYNSGATVHFEVSARTGSKVTASFNGKTTELTESVNQQGFGASEGFTIYTGSYTLTNINTTDLNLGPITYTAEYNGITEEYLSGNILVQKSTEVLGYDPSVTPTGGKYINVGSGYIAEVVNYSAETMDPYDNDGYSRPTNNYLPQGTLDYCSPDIMVSNDGTNNYRMLRCGWRVFTYKNNPPAKKTKVIDCYIGRLPDHNELGFASMTDNGQFTVLVLDTMWKAPFRFELEAQDYANPNGGGGRSYEISNFTSSYLDITFCYATVFEGTVDVGENPIFSSAVLTQNESDCTLRLYFKKAGGFYGWDAWYNAQGQLCFKFLNPKKATAASNAYGANLTGIRIMIDVGHGGSDPGTVSKVLGTTYRESERNMAMAQALKLELESMGATVVLNHNNNTLTVDERILTLKGWNPDLCIAIHHNATTNTTSRGFDAFYYAPFSHNITHAVNNATTAANIYTSTNVGWHVYYIGRQSNCPVVLTENGYMSNKDDMAAIADSQTVTQKVQAIAKGVADYYLNQ